MKQKSIKKYKPQSGLEKATKKIILLNTDDEYIKSFIHDLMTEGVEGGITGLIYYQETCEFFTKNRADIVKLLNGWMRFKGTSCLSKLFGDKFDANDFLCLEENNQNLIAWFAFEQTAFGIAQELGGIL